jgi:hypothetical protein
MVVISSWDNNPIHFPPEGMESPRAQIVKIVTSRIGVHSCANRSKPRGLESIDTALPPFENVQDCFPAAVFGYYLNKHR